MKGKIGTSTGIEKGKRLAREFFHRSREAGKRRKALGVGAIGKSKPPKEIVVISPPKKRMEEY